MGVIPPSRSQHITMAPFLPLLLLSAIAASALELTVEVRPRTEECFFAPVSLDDELTVEYQVVDSRGAGGQFGDLDINFRIVAPRNYTEMAVPILIIEYKKERGRHTYNGTRWGDYKVCLDNKHSYLNSKTVFLSIETYKLTKEASDKTFKTIVQLFVEEQQYLGNAEDIHDELLSILSHLNIRNFQNL